jgi:hypothetical protein
MEMRARMLFIPAEQCASSTECRLRQKYIICFINGVISQPSTAVQGFIRVVSSFVLAFIHQSARKLFTVVFIRMENASSAYYVKDLVALIRIFLLSQ